MTTAVYNAEWTVGPQKGSQIDKLTLAWSKFIPVQPTAKQLAFLFLPTLEALFGGAAGPGKSVGLLMSGLQYVDNPHYAALLLRKSYADLSLPGALMDKAAQWLGGTAAVWQAEKKTWAFPSGATLTFGYLDNTQDKYRYQSSEFQFIGFDELTQFQETDYRYMFSRLRRCEGSDIPIRMRAASNPGNIGHCVPYGEVLTTDGWRSIQDVRVGEYVASADDEGKGVFVEVDQVYADHYKGDLLVHNNGNHIAATPNHQIARRTETKNAKGRRLHGISLVNIDSLSGVTRVIKSITPADDAPIAWGVTPKPIATRRRRLNQPGSLPGLQYCKLLGWMVSEGSTVDRDKAFGIAQSKAENRDTIRRLLEDCGFTFSESDTGFTVYAPDWYAHFKDLGKCRDKHIPRIVFEKANKAELAALLESAMAGDGDKHGIYYTLSRQLADDIYELGFRLGYSPRLTSRTREDRNGPTYAVRLRRRKHALIERKHFGKVPYDGKVYCLGIGTNHRFFLRQRGTIWLSGNSWVQQRFMVERNDDRVFLPARIEDNPYLDRVEYEKTLAELDPITRLQLLNGDWSARQSGNKFRREWFEIVDEAPVDCQWVRRWDMAATEPKKGSDPDWTVGCLMGKSSNRTLYIKDVRRLRGTPGACEALVRQTAETDGRNVAVRMEQEPGSSGVKVIDDYTRRVLMGWDFQGVPSTGNKEVRANPLASQAEAGNVKLVRGAWIGAFLDEAELFPLGSHDDQVDAASGALLDLTSEPEVSIGWI